mgnify:CR=1 FL=1
MAATRVAVFPMGSRERMLVQRFVRSEESHGAAVYGDATDEAGHKLIALSLEQLEKHLGATPLDVCKALRWSADTFKTVTGIDAHLPALLVALRPQGSDALTGGAEGPEGSWLCSAFFIVAIVWMGWRRAKKSGSGRAPA